MEHSFKEREAMTGLQFCVMFFVGYFTLIICVLLKIGKGSK